MRLNSHRGERLQGLGEGLRAGRGCAGESLFAWGRAIAEAAACAQRRALVREAGHERESGERTGVGPHAREVVGWRLRQVELGRDAGDGHSAAAGGGLSLALAADIRLAAPTAKFACSFVKVGLSAGELGTSWTLPRLVGPGRAAEIAFTGRVVGAPEAERIGLVNRVVADPVEEAFAVAAAISANSPSGVRMSKRALQRNQEVSSYAAALELENRGQALLTRTEDMPEALAAFREHRAPRFGGR